MAHNTSNSTPFIMQEIYSRFLVENLPEILLPDGFTRDVSDFSNGDTLNIPTVGAVTLQQASEGTPLTFNPIDSGRVTLTITDFPGDAWAVTDVLREDGYLVERLLQERMMESSRAMGEYFETRFLEVANSAQTANNANSVNGVAHRIVGNGASRQIELEDFAFMKFAFDKAKVPQMGRIAVVDPIVELTLNKLYNASWTVNNPQFSGIITEGFSQTHKFVTNIFGFDIWTSNLLPTVGVEGSLTDRDGNTTASVAGDVANIFMCVASDQTKPIMKAWRRKPTSEAWRDPETREDKIQSTGRFGLGAQRIDTLATIITNPTVS